jgi:hypothetical protein
MGGMRNTARFRASAEGVHERRDQVWGEGNNRVERRTGCPRGAGPSTGCVGRAGNQQIGRGQLEIPRGWVVSRDGVVAKNLHAFYATHTARPTLTPATNLTAPYAPRATCTWPCTAIAALAALLMVVGRRLRFYGSSRCTCERARKGAVFRIPPTILSVRVRRI